ncbi:MAG TPA: biotin transporter BioY [Clostridiales bacterium]|jgi:biotin transport system substrate-specific component|nr:biotin transporter BioY [Clostridiales bacterium]
MRAEIKSLIVAATFTAAICIGAWIKIPFLFVPLTLQVFFVNTAILTQKARYATLSVASYMLLGLLGLPVFSGGGGPGYVLYPTFGYLVGFLLAALSSAFIDKKRVYLQSLVNEALLYLCGVLYFFLVSNFYLHNNVSVARVLVWCFLVFIPGDLVSVILSCELVKILSRHRVLQNIPG